MDIPRDTPGEHDAEPSRTPRPGLAESLRQIGANGRGGLSASKDAAKALRTLVGADLALAGGALGRATVFFAIATVIGISAWMLLMGTLAVVLHDGLGWSWAMSLGACAALGVALTALAAVSALRYLRHTRLTATRRRLGQLRMSDWERLATQAESGGEGEGVSGIGTDGRRRAAAARSTPP